MAKTKKYRPTGVSVRAAILEALEGSDNTAHAIAMKVRNAHKQTALAYLYSGRNARIEMVEEIMAQAGVAACPQATIDALLDLVKACRRCGRKLPGTVRKVLEQFDAKHQG